MANAHTLGRCTMSDLELGFSARNAEEWDTIASAVSALATVEVESADFRRALTVQRSLAATGLKGRRVPDLIIAAVAERLGVQALHYDEDFEFIAAVTGQPHAWVVPRGSVD